MPEYLAPGVYVEETSFRAKSIEGVSTTTTGFIGPTRYGPTNLEPEVITSLGEFERMYGDRQSLSFSGLKPVNNYMWHAARAFFEQGGKRLYVSRVFKRISETNTGHAEAWIPGRSPDSGERPGSDAEVRKALWVYARFPGELGKMRVRITLDLGQNILGGRPDPDAPPGSTRRTIRTVNGLTSGDVVWISDVSPSPPTDPKDERGDFYLAEFTEAQGWRFTRPLQGGLSSPPASRALDELTPSPDPKLSDKIRVVTLRVTVMQPGENELPQVWAGLPLHPRHKRAGEPDSVFDRFAARPSSLAQARRLPIVVERGTVGGTGGSGSQETDVSDGIDVLSALFQAKSSLADALSRTTSTDAERSLERLLDGGNDGLRPGAVEYEGEAPDDEPYKTGLKSFEDIEDISIVAAPGSTFGYANGYRLDASTIVSHLISHAERMRYRIAVLDSGDGQTISEVRAMRARYDSKHAAMYYPWVRILDPVTSQEAVMPPSGFVAGIYARNDIERAVYKAPANETVALALGFEIMLNKAQQEVLNPEGINCFRYFEGRGYRLWGARTISSDPEWKYVNLRRYFAYVERSIDRGTQWAVFEPNGERLWANVRQTIKDFLFNEWQSGALLGEKAEQAFFVRCDRSTMTQNDLDNGRLICLIGIAPLRPAEFVIFRIGQWTADRKQ